MSSPEPARSRPPAQRHLRLVRDADRPAGARLPDLPGVDGAVQRAVQRSIGFMFLLLLVLGLGALAAVVLIKMDVTVEGVGVLRPLRVWPVRAMSAGLVSEVEVAPNDSVRRGQPLVRLDPVLADGRLAQLEAELRARRAALRYAETRLPLTRRQHRSTRAQAEARLIQTKADLQEELTRFGLGARMDSVLLHHRAGNHVGIDRAVAAVRAAEAEIAGLDAELDLVSTGSLDLERQRAELQQLEEELALAREQRERLVVLAPATGVVITDRLERLHGASVSEGQMLLEIAEPDDWQVDLLVAQRDMNRIRVGDRARVEVTALKATRSELLDGRVVAVAPEPVPTGSLGAVAADAITEGGIAGAVARLGSDAYRVTIKLDPDAVEEIGADRLRTGYSVIGYVVTKRERIVVLLWQRLRERI